MKVSNPANSMWTDACMLIERAERLHRQFFQPSVSTAPAMTWEPPVDIVETDREIAIVAALPGVEAQDLEVGFEADELVIAGLRRRPAVARGAAVHRLEIPYGRFERRIRFGAMTLRVDRSELASGCLFIGLTKQL
jgi:HSP20 family protein